MQDTIPILLEYGAVRIFLLRVNAPTAVTAPGRVGREHFGFLVLPLLARDDHRLTLLALRSRIAQPCNTTVRLRRLYLRASPSQCPNGSPTRSCRHFRDM